MAYWRNPDQYERKIDSLPLEEKDEIVGLFNRRGGSDFVRATVRPSIWRFEDLVWATARSVPMLLLGMNGDYPISKAPPSHRRELQERGLQVPPMETRCYFDSAVVAEVSRSPMLWLRGPSEFGQCRRGHLSVQASGVDQDSSSGRLTAAPSFEGTRNRAESLNPRSVFVYRHGSLFVSDSEFHSVRKVDALTGINRNGSRRRFLGWVSERSLQWRWRFRDGVQSIDA